MELSACAKSYLAKNSRRESVTDEKEIRAAFARKNLEAPTELIRFQQKYGGFTYYVWRELIVFGILHTGPRRGDFLGNEKELSIEEPDENIKENH